MQNVLVTLKKVVLFVKLSVILLLSQIEDAISCLFDRQVNSQMFKKFWTRWTECE